MKKYVDIVVTYNRLDLLKENISALINQTFKDHDIMIINNASTDKTEEYVLGLNNKKIKYFNTGKNLGGAGGFAFGIEKAIELNYDFAWIMDDDSIPTKNALESLVEKSKDLNNKFSFLASLVYWTDNKIFPMNLPTFTYEKSIRKNLQLLLDNKVIEIESCSFVGCFVNLDFAKKTALPIAEFFIYGDDIEYTSRLKNLEKAYFVPDSLIIHKAPSNKGADIVTADKSRIERFYLQSRNGFYIARKNHTILKRINTVFGRLVRIIKYSEDYKLKRSWYLIKGTFAGMFFNPKLKYVCMAGEDNDEKI